MKGADAGQTANTVTVPEGVDADLLMKVLGNPEDVYKRQGWRMRFITGKILIRR